MHLRAALLFAVVLASRWLLVASAADSKDKDLQVCKADKAEDEETDGKFSYCIPESYDKLWVPEEEAPRTVGIDLILDQVEEIEEVKSEFTATSVVRITWQDKGIRVIPAENGTSGDDFSPSGEGRDFVIIDASLLDSLWTPDIFINRMTIFKVHNVLNALSKCQLFLNSTVVLTLKASLSVDCDFDFARFPFDSQTCDIVVGAYLSPVQEVVFKGSYFFNSTYQKNIAFTITVEQPKDEGKMDEDDVTGGILVQKEFDYYRRKLLKIEELGAGLEYSSYKLTMKMKRVLTGYLIRTFIPATVVVLVSWISYFVATQYLGPRLLVMLTLTVAEVELLNGIKSPSSDTTAVSIYVLICMSFVILNICEYAIILFRRSALVGLLSKCGKKCKKSRKSSAPSGKSQKKSRPSQHSSAPAKKSGKNGKSQRSHHSSPPSRKTVKLKKVHHCFAPSTEKDYFDDMSHYFDEPSSAKEDNLKKSSRSPSPSGKSESKSKKDKDEKDEDKKTSELVTEHAMDFISMGLVPIGFVVFQLTYWLYYLYF